MSDFKPTVAIDFDGVIHQYTSPWTNAREVRDDPVEGAFKFIEELQDSNYKVCVFSSRCAYEGSTQAIRDWLIKHGFDEERIPELSFTDSKPPALLYIDDRGYQFRGTFPTVEYIANFKTWNK